MKKQVCVVIPTYNNAGTILQVIEDVRKSGLHIIVVNDGSTDQTSSLLASLQGVVKVEYERNQGKGYALKCGMRKALGMGFKYAITIDADGQHYADDIPLFLEAHQKHPDALIVGSRRFDDPNMPGGNTFANRFSNFWFKLQTACSLPDTQTGFRLYPLLKMGKMPWMTYRYEAELEMLVYAAWHNIELVPIPIKVYYPPMDARITHFRPVYDSARISILNTVLCFLAVVYGYPNKLLKMMRS